MSEYVYEIWVQMTLSSLLGDILPVWHAPTLCQCLHLMTKGPRVHHAIRAVTRSCHETTGSCLLVRAVVGPIPLQKSRIECSQSVLCRAAPCRVSRRRITLNVALSSRTFRACLDAHIMVVDHVAVTRGSRGYKGRVTVVGFTFYHQDSPSGITSLWSHYDGTLHADTSVIAWI